MPPEPEMISPAKFFHYIFRKRSFKRGKKLPEVQKDIIVSKLQQKINLVSIFVENKKAPLCGAFFIRKFLLFSFLQDTRGNT